MNIPNIKEHLTCYNYEHGKASTIELFTLSEGDKLSLKRNCNKIICIRQKDKGQLVFLPANEEYNYLAPSNLQVIVFRLFNPISLCMGYSVERLYEEGSLNVNPLPSENEGKYGSLIVLPAIDHLLQGIGIGIADRMSCRCWFELKISELFMLLRTYYSKQKLYAFLYSAISRDNRFVNDVLKYWRNNPSVEELSVVMNITPRQLSARFKTVFGIPPGKWIIQEKAKVIHHEITCTTKFFNQIAEENGFHSESIFTRFCKREFGNTPSELRANKKTDQVENVK